MCLPVYDTLQAEKYSNACSMLIQLKLQQGQRNQSGYRLVLAGPIFQEGSKYFSADQLTKNQMHG